MLSATPMAAPIGASARPCSTCSSTNAPSRASRSSSGPSRLGSAPAAVVAPAVGDRVQVAAGDDGILPTRVPRTPPGPQVAVTVLFHGQAEAVRLAGEPVPAPGVGRGPGVAAVAGGPRVAAQRL